MKLHFEIGEPEFLRDWLRAEETDQVGYFLNKLGGEGYPTPGGERELQQAIHDFEISREDPARRFTGVPRRVIITTGATQGLAAALYAAAQHGTVEKVFAPAPYWSEVPRIIQGLGMDHVFDEDEARGDPGCLILGTLPNNPDGYMINSHGMSLDVWDAAYADPIYGWDGYCPPNRIKVASASKLFGCSNMRIGWVLAPAELADDVIDYVQRTTAGVSRLSQAYLLGLIYRVMADGCDELRKEARRRLQMNRLAYADYLSDFVNHRNFFQASTGRCNGMFAWFEPHDFARFNAAAERAEVVLAPGANFGRPEYMRMSMGRMPDITEEALGRLYKDLKG